MRICKHAMRASKYSARLFPKSAKQLSNSATRIWNPPCLFPNPPGNFPNQVRVFLYSLKFIKEHLSWEKEYKSCNITRIFCSPYNSAIIIIFFLRITDNFLCGGLSGGLDVSKVTFELCKHLDPNFFELSKFVILRFFFTYRSVWSNSGFEWVCSSLFDSKKVQVPTISRIGIFESVSCMTKRECSGVQKKRKRIWNSVLFDPWIRDRKTAIDNDFHWTTFYKIVEIYILDIFWTSSAFWPLDTGSGIQDKHPGPPKLPQTMIFRFSSNNILQMAEIYILGSFLNW